MNDEAVSEILGYAILAGVVIVAVAGISTGAGDLIAGSVRQTSLSGTVSTANSFETIVSEVAETDNYYGTTLEMFPPQGYECIVTDRFDDFRTVDVYAGNDRRMSLRTGSFRLDSGFRGTVYEGGAVVSGDQGYREMIRSPAIFLQGTAGHLSLYVYLTGLSLDSWSSGAGMPTIVSIKFVERDTEEWIVAPGTSTRLIIKTGDTGAWKEFLEREGFSVTVNDDIVTASTGGVTDVHVSYTVVRIDRQE